MIKKNDYLRFVCTLLITSYSLGHCSFKSILNDEGLRQRKPLLKESAESFDIDTFEKNFKTLSISSEKISTDMDLSSISQKYFFFV
ncbi:MAG: hypothetical protein ACRYGR_10715 [Janthinobacterium lividum]